MRTLLALALFLVQPDPRFVRMWDAAQRQRPAHLNSVSRIASADEPGTPLVIRGQVLNTAGRPAPDVEVFAYHTDASGAYARPGAEDPWRLKGWAVTDADGRFEFRTIRPAPYPNRTVPAHVHAALITSCCGRQFADLMFEGDPLATPEYRERFARAGEHGLYAPVERVNGPETVSYTIRIRPQGDF